MICDKIKDVCGIYRIRNLINDDFYIGSSSTLKRRMRSHRDNLNKRTHDNIYLQNSYTKYGDDNFAFEVLLICEENDKLFYEQQFIDTLKPKYNILKIVKDPPIMLGENHPRSLLSTKVVEEIIKELSFGASLNDTAFKFGLKRSFIEDIKYARKYLHLSRPESYPKYIVPKTLSSERKLELSGIRKAEYIKAHNIDIKNMEVIPIVPESLKYMPGICCVIYNPTKKAYLFHTYRLINIRDSFNELRRNKHTNKKLQDLWNNNSPKDFEVKILVACDKVLGKIVKDSILDRGWLFQPNNLLNFSKEERRLNNIQASKISNSKWTKKNASD